MASGQMRSEAAKTCKTLFPSYSPKGLAVGIKKNSKLKSQEVLLFIALFCSQ